MTHRDELGRLLTGVPAVVVPRAVVQAFAVDMEIQLRANDYKAGWDAMDFNQILRRLKQEVRELEKEVRTGCRMARVRGEAADIGNFAAFAGHRARAYQAEGITESWGEGQ